jgi:serpin B
VKRLFPLLALLLVAGPTLAADPVPSANNAFAVDLYHRLAAEGPGKNVFFSPYSLFSALSMTAQGARGETAAQMGQALRYPQELRDAAGGKVPWKLAPVHAGVAALNARLLVSKPGHEVSVANALWVDKNTPMLKSFYAALQPHYKTTVYGVDFRGNAEQGRQQINRWSTGMTKGRIPEILPKGSLDAYTRMVLTNAIYFKGKWAEPFKKEDTKERDFHLDGGKKVRVSMMYQIMAQARYGAFNGDGSAFETPKFESAGAQNYPGAGGFQMLEVPYSGNELSMVVLLPRSADGLPALEKMLSAEKLSHWADWLTARDVYNFAPKFRMETDYKMRPALIALGMSRAFSEYRAEFEGMCESEKLHIRKVLHRAFVEVNEEGTEAAATTAVDVAACLAAPGVDIQKPFIPTFKADHPFLFLIRDKKTGAILFLGRVVDPR